MERAREELYQRRIGLAFACRRAHARLENHASVRQRLDPVDGVTATLGRQAHRDDEALCGRRPRSRRPSAHGTFGRMYLRITCWRKMMMKNRTIGEISTGPRCGMT